MHIKGYLTEGNMLNDIADMFGKFGWETERYFKKTVFSKSYIDPMNPILPDMTMRIGVAEHLILKHPDEETDLYYGFATYGEVSTLFGFVPKKLWPKNGVETTKDPELSASIIAPFDNYKQLADWATNKYPQVKQTHTLYMYMMEQVTDDLPHNGDIVIATDKDLRRSALDVEVLETELWMMMGSSYFKVKKAQPSYGQSPYAAASIRIPVREKKDSTQSFETPFVQGNWHHDSKILVRGWIDNEHCMLTLLADAAAGYQDNGVPLIPLYLGKFDSEDPDDVENFALMSGSAFKAETPTFDYDNPKHMIDNMTNFQPMLKDYVMTPGNGIDTVMVYRNKQGSKYQAYHLFVEAPYNEMPPELSFDKRDYPRAWKRADSHVHAYKHNPSRYSGFNASTQSIQSSYVKIAHIDDGVRGTLRNMIATAPMSLNNEDVLKVAVELCSDDGKHEYDEYDFFLIEGVSALTKIPGTPYRQLGIGIMNKKLNDDTELTPEGSTIMSIYTSKEEYDSRVNVYLNGRIILENQEVTTNSGISKIKLPLRAGTNELQVELLANDAKIDPQLIMTFVETEGGEIDVIGWTSHFYDVVYDDKGKVKGDKPINQQRINFTPKEEEEETEEKQ